MATTLIGDLAAGALFPLDAISTRELKVTFDGGTEGRAIPFLMKMVSITDMF